MNIGKNISYYRKLRKITQEQLAERLGISAQSVSKWENELSSPEVAIIPQIAKELRCDVNALFAEEIKPKRKLRCDEVPDIAYDEVLRVMERARYAVETEGQLEKCVERAKKNFAGPEKKIGCIKSVEGTNERGAVFASDALTFIDRYYGTADSALLFDSDKAGEILAVLGDRNARAVLKFMYEKLIEGGEKDKFATPEQISEGTGLPIHDVAEAAVKLRHIGFISESEKIENGKYIRRYAGAREGDYVYIMAMLRLAYVFANERTAEFMLANNLYITMNLFPAE